MFDIGIKAKPFLKWAGGKTQLITSIEKVLPKELMQKRFTYIEPFVGSGAVLFWMLSKYPNIKKAVINDINQDLINTYKIIADTPFDLIQILEDYQSEFHSLEHDAVKKKEYYYEKRNLFNSRTQSNQTQAALFIFLNRTCFNGLYRVNSKNEFNVPMGSYVKPTICFKSNILVTSNALQKVEILSGDFEQTINFADENSLFYFDPPYKPISASSSFNTYANNDFNDSEQVRLRNFCSMLDQLNHWWILSNSDVKSIDLTNNFFDDLYAKFNIQRVEAKRSINSNPEKRGNISELLIINYINKHNSMDRTYGK